MKEHGKRLVIASDTCLITLPKLAKHIGRNEAIFLQQLHFWLSAENPNGTVYKGQKWIYNTYEDWKNQLKIFSLSTIRRIIKKLEMLDVIYSKKLGKKQSDQTKWYTINYQKLEDTLSSRTNQETGRKEEPSHLFKMNSPCVQNEQIICKETEITSENKTISSEEATLIKQKDHSQQVNFVKKERELKIKNNLATELLEIWNQTVGQGGAIVQLTKKRAQHLVAAFKYRFESSVEKWKHFCQQITTSDFLMGKAKATFRASLDWVLRFDIIQRIIEGEFGIKIRDTDDDNYLEEKTMESLRQEINSSEETAEVKELRQKILHKFGENLYKPWFKDLTIVMEEQGRVVELRSRSRFISDYIQVHYLNELRSLTLKDIHILC
jgi:hypothetical protein